MPIWAIYITRYAIDRIIRHDVYRNKSDTGGASLCETTITAYIEGVVRPDEDE